jgi:glycosyltransferase involved in cell wall biosynthesis
MATGRPLGASATGGIPELVAHEDTGLLVTPGDAAALADALETLARDAALRTRMGAAGAEKVRREFDLHANARELVKRFRESVRSIHVDPGAHA